MPPRKKKKPEKPEKPKAKPKPKKPIKGKKAGQIKAPPAITRKDHDESAPAVVGSEERMSDAILFAWSQRRRGKTYETIAKLCTQPAPIGLNLTVEPSIGTIHNWIIKGRDIVNEMLKEEVEAEREMMKAWVGQIIEKFLDVSTSDNVMVNRKQLVDGEWTTMLDENAFDEQQKAARVALKAISQLANLYGFDKPVPGDKFNLTSIHLQMIQNINRGMASEPGKVIEVQGVTLELATGIDGI